LNDINELGRVSPVAKLVNSRERMRSAGLANFKVYDESSPLNDINELGRIKSSSTAELMNSRE